MKRFCSQVTVKITYVTQNDEKGKAVLICATKAYRKSRVVAVLILNLGASWR